MKSKNIQRLSFQSVYEKGFEESIIQNFIISDSLKVEDHMKIGINNPFCFDGILLLIGIRGRGRIRINYQEYEFSSNSLLTVFPNSIFEAIDVPDDCLSLILLISSDFILKLPFPKDFDLLAKISNQPIQKITESKKSELLGYHSFIVEYFNNTKHVFSNNVATNIFTALLFEIGAIYYENEKSIVKRKYSRVESIVESFFKLLYVYHNEQRSAAFYADKLCITIKYLSAILKKNTGRSINVLINEAVIITAKIHLKSSNKTVLQISEELNFPNPSFFGRYFKQYTNMTPLEYRETIESYL